MKLLCLTIKQNGYRVWPVTAILNIGMGTGEFS